jgi:TonB family protein
MDRLSGGHRTNKVGTLRDLDESPKVIHAVSPRYPAALATEKVAGRVILDFFIDEQGKVRMPALEKTDHEAFVDAAAAALMEWQFAPPTRNGKPVIVQARQVFVFTPEG